MNTVILISTIHKEIGNCNSEELYQLIKKIGPEVIFLEAHENSISEYQHYLFLNFDVLHQKLEIAAIQKYSRCAPFEFIPVLDIDRTLSENFHRKYSIVCANIEVKKIIDEINFRTLHQGFDFLNSPECDSLHEEQRELERRILNDDELEKLVTEDIDGYENNMINNILKYCEQNQFGTGIFMCGNAHRKSLVKKFQDLKTKDLKHVNWLVYEG